MIVDVLCVMHGQLSYLATHNSQLLCSFVQLVHHSNARQLSWLQPIGNPGEQHHEVEQSLSSTSPLFSCSSYSLLQLVSVPNSKIIMDALLAPLKQGDPVAVAIAIAIVVIGILLPLAVQLIKGSAKPFLDPQQWQSLTLSRIDQLTHNTKRFVFSLPDPKMLLGLPTGQHITFMAKDADGKDVYRWARGRPSCVAAATTPAPFSAAGQLGNSCTHACCGWHLDALTPLCVACTGPTPL